jgi:Peptidase M50B-like
MFPFLVSDETNSQWLLAGCCRREEWIFIGLFVAYYLITHFLYWKDFMKPMKLLGVFVHEMGHASATWLTCGKVKNIEVYQNEGGITGFSGGWRLIIIPAGYVGGAFWGGCFVTLSGHRIGATVAACIVSAALLIALV